MIFAQHTVSQRWGGGVVRGLFRRGNFGGGISPPLVIPKAQLHYNADTLKFRQGKISPPFLKDVFPRPPTECPPPPCGDTWLCQVMIAIKEIAQAPTCTAKEKRSRLITDRSDRP